MGDGIEGIGTWWADALALEAAEQAATRTPERLARVTERKKAEIAQYRETREPLPPKTRWRARKQVGRLLHEYDSNLCGICHMAIDLDLATPHPGSLQLDHIIPRAGVGADTWDNIQIAHAACNLMKSDYLDGYPPAEEAATQMRVAIGHWENPDLLRHDFETVYQRVKEHDSAIRKMNAELDAYPEADPRREGRRNETLPVALARMHDERLLWLYRGRLLAHERRALRKADESRDH